MVSRRFTCTRNHCVKVTSSCPFYFSLSRVPWIGLKQQRTRATSTSRLASMRTPSSATQRPSLCAPQSRRRICRRFTRIEQQPTNSRWVKHTLNVELRLLYSEMSLWICCFDTESIDCFPQINNIQHCHYYMCKESRNYEISRNSCGTWSCFVIFPWLLSM